MARALLLALLLVSSPALGEREFWYGDRPNPLSFTTPRSRTEGSPLNRGEMAIPTRMPGGYEVEDTLRAHLEVAAQLTLYREYRKVFVGRGPEYIHDMYLLLLNQLDPRELERMGLDRREIERVHLANVSRAISPDPDVVGRDGRNLTADPLLRDYLIQQGITLERLRAGEKFLIVDTTASGSLYQRIVRLFPGFERQFALHIVAFPTRGAAHPTSRVFHAALRPNDSSQAPSLPAVDRYENIYRFTPWGERIQRRRVGGRDVLDVVGSSDGHLTQSPDDTTARQNRAFDVRRTEAFMEHQAWWMQQPQNLELGLRRLRLYSELWSEAQKLLQFDALVPRHPDGRINTTVTGWEAARDLANTVRKEFLGRLREMLDRPENRHDPAFHAALRDFEHIMRERYPFALNGFWLREASGHIDPVAIRRGAPAAETELARRIRYARGEMAEGRLVNARRMTEIRNRALGGLVYDHLDKADARAVVLDALVDNNPDVAHATARALDSRTLSHLPEPVVREILTAAARALTHELNVGHNDIAQSLARLLKNSGADRLIPEEFARLLVELGRIADAAPSVDTGNGRWVLDLLGRLPGQAGCSVLMARLRTRSQRR